MTAPEVTREDPSKIVADLLRRFSHPRAYAGDYYADFARRILTALADDIGAVSADEHQRLQWDLEHVIQQRDAVNEAQRRSDRASLVMLECIDRLRDGWEPGEFTERQGIPFGWCWHKTTYDNGRVTFYERHAMSPEQQAVMARG